MAARRPIVFVSGFLHELPIGDGVAGTTLPNIVENPTLSSVAPGEISIDPNGLLIIRIGNIIWRFAASEAISFAGQLDFSKARNSHWIG